MDSKGYTLSLLSEKSLTIFINKGISLEAHHEVLVLKNMLNRMNWSWVVEIVPSYSSLTIIVDFDFYKSQKSLLFFFNQWLSELIFTPLEISDTNAETKEIPVLYNGVDLEFVAEHCQLTKEEIIDIHSKAIYTVAMIGFLPGFPYLIGMDERLTVPRRLSPRLKVDKGSVGLAGNQTGIYPCQSPGGWQIVGTTNQSLFDFQQLNWLKIGDNVRFIPIYER